MNICFVFARQLSPNTRRRTVDRREAPDNTVQSTATKIAERRPSIAILQPPSQQMRGTQQLKKKGGVAAGLATLTNSTGTFRLFFWWTSISLNALGRAKFYFLGNINHFWQQETLTKIGSASLKKSSTKGGGRLVQTHSCPNASFVTHAGRGKDVAVSSKTHTNNITHPYRIVTEVRDGWSHLLGARKKSLLKEKRFHSFCDNLYDAQNADFLPCWCGCL